MPSAEPFPATPPVPQPASFGCVLQHSAHGATWIRLSGELDLSNAPQLAARLSEAPLAARLLVIDLRLLTFIDSSGLAALIAAHDRARRSQRRLVLVRGPRQVDQLLKLSGLADRMEITDLKEIQTAPRPSDLAAPRGQSRRPLRTSQPQRAMGQSR